MANRIDWDDVSRKQRAQRHGTEYGFDELPPIGTYADKIRYDLDYGDRGLPALEKTQPSCNAKQQESEATRIGDLKKTLAELVNFTEKKIWSLSNEKDQTRVLNNMQNTLIALVTVDPSAKKDPCCIKAKHLLLTRIRKKCRKANSKPIGIYGSNSSQLRGFKK